MGFLRNLRLPALGAALLALCALAASPVAAEPLVIESGGESHAFDIEVARTPQQRARGLMYRREIAPDYGMLFEYDEEQQITMWMKNTFIPLDMIFIRADGTIHHVEEETTPFSTDTISSRGPVKAVLEVAGGTAERLGFGKGDTVRHPLFDDAR